MSEDSQSTESMPPSAEQSDSAGPGPGPANANNNNNNDSSSPARSKSRNAAPATKTATPTDKPEKAEGAKTTDATVTAAANANANGAVAQSQPMTVSNSTSSEMTSMTDAASNAAAPYSTRSRGRREGAPRPNYAEDVEMDFELTSPAPGTKSTAHSTKRSTAISSVNGSPSVATDSEKGPATSTRKGQSTAANATANGTQANAAAKEPIPGTSTFSANATNSNNASSASSASSASRKRKHPPSGATGANPSGSAKRVVSSTSGYKHDIRLSNMMTFENSGARLRNGKLKADDGTTLEVNGKLYMSMLFLVFAPTDATKIMST